MQRIIELRSLIPASVHVMSLTATATKSLHEEVTAILGMKNPQVIAVSPSKPNITYMIKNFGFQMKLFKCIITYIMTSYPLTVTCKRCHYFKNVELVVSCIVNE